MEWKQFINELKDRLLVSEVLGQYMQLKKHGREWKGLSPFTNEKTPSFTVNDEKQFYHCFSSGEHGDIISFLTKTQNLSFVEAVEMLADKAGIEVPRNKRLDPAKVLAQKTALEALTAARDYFEKQLLKNKIASDYLTQRGVGDKVLKQFHLGYAPANNSSLRQALKGQGFSDETMLAAGLVAKSENGGEIYDRFRNRIMFPIENRKGDTIAFGGRALDPKAPAKYLNSPETELFHKSEVFYGLPQAAKPAYDRAQLIIVEGYMDVIALHQAGCACVVASLGTALTEQQMEAAWRLTDEPIICLDGDKAGQRAAARAIERALKLLRAGKSLRFAYMPLGKDPDDVVRLAGLQAFENHIANAQPLSEAMFFNETNNKSMETPERRAALRQRFDGLIGEIQNSDVQRYYRGLFNRRLEQLFWRLDRNYNNEKINIAAPAIMPDGNSSKERILLGLLIDQPSLLQKHYEDIENLYLASNPHSHLRDALILASQNEAPTEPEWFYENLSEEFSHLLDVIYGRNEEGVVDGHNFYQLFPALSPQMLEHHLEGFVEKCLACFIHEQYHEALKEDCQNAHRDYLSKFDEDGEEEKRERWVKMKDLLEEDKNILFSEITEIGEEVDSLGEHFDYSTSFAAK